MVISVTSLTGSGLRDWLFQRISAVVLTLYTFFLAGVFLIQGPMTYENWTALFSNTFVAVFTFLALLALTVHARIGLWIILTDYIKPYCIRLFFQIIIFLSLMSFLFWGIIILWRL